MTLIAERIQFCYSGKNRIFRDLSVEFGPGRTVLLGPNGAGKSTLFKLLAGLENPSSGKILIGSQWRPSSFLRSHVGFMPQEILPVPGLKVSEVVQYAAWLSGVSAKKAKERAEEAVGMVGLLEQSGKKSTQLSGGQLRRLGLACVLSQHPEVLLLDEPTAGLDPAQRHRFRTVLTELPKELTIIVSTHQVDDVEISYDQVKVLAAGEMKWQGTPKEFLGLADEQGIRQAEMAYMKLIGGE